MQAAHLTRQQIIRAVPHDVALLNSFSDVYIKPRTSGDFVSTTQAPLAKLKNDMLKAVELELRNIEVLDVITASSTLRVKELCTHSAHELGNQIAFSVIQVDEGIGYYKTTLLHTLYNIFIAYQRCPKDILLALRLIIDSNFNERSDYAAKRKAYGQSLNFTAFKHFETYSILEANQRFFPEQYTLSEEAIKRSNASALILYTQLVAAYYMNIKCSEDGLKFVDYSRAVHMKTLSDDFPEYPLLRNCLNYVEYIEDCTVRVIKSIQDKLDDETTIHVLRLLNWKNRFYDVAFSCMFIKSNENSRRILDVKLVKSLYLHSKWVEKHLFEELFKMLPPEHELKIPFHTKVLTFTGDNNQISENSAIFSKKVRKLIGQPILYAGQEQYDLCQTRRNIFKTASVDLKQPLAGQKEILSLNYNVVSDLKLALDVPDEETIDGVIENIEKKPENPDEFHKTDATILPLNACIIQRVLNILKEQIFEVVCELTADEELKLRNDFGEVLVNLVHFARMSKGLAPELLSLLEYLAKVANGTIDVKEVKTR